MIGIALDLEIYKTFGLATQDAYPRGIIFLFATLLKEHTNLMNTFLGLRITDSVCCGC